MEVKVKFGHNTLKHAETRKYVIDICFHLSPVSTVSIDISRYGCCCCDISRPPQEASFPHYTELFLSTWASSNQYWLGQFHKYIDKYFLTYLKGSQDYFELWFLPINGRIHLCIEGLLHKLRSLSFVPFSYA